MRIRILKPLSFIVLLMAMAISGSLVRAQMDHSMPPGATGITPQPLGSGLPSTAPGLAMGLVQLTYAPGATLNTHTHPGASILYVESGTLTYTLIEGTATVTRASADPATPPVTETLATGVIELAAGDSLFEDADVIHTANNAGEEPAVVLIANLLTAGEPVSTFLEDGTPTP
jgi:quercetin dioxygenase-like cupin family protein